MSDWGSEVCFSGSPETNPVPPAVNLAVDIPPEHAHLLPGKGGAAKHGSPRRFNSPRKDIRWSALGLGPADNAHALARTFETAEDLADLLATMLGAKRTAEPGHACGGRSRPREADIQTLLQRRDGDRVWDGWGGSGR